MQITSKPMLISGNANRPLAEEIARYATVNGGLDIDLLDARVEKFNDKEIFVEVFEKCSRRGYVYHSADIQPDQR